MWHLKLKAWIDAMRGGPRLVAIVGDLKRDVELLNFQVGAPATPQRLPNSSKRTSPQTTYLAPSLSTHVASVTQRFIDPEVT